MSQIISSGNALILSLLHALAYFNFEFEPIYRKIRFLKKKNMFLHLKRRKTFPFLQVKYLFGVFFLFENLTDCGQLQVKKNHLHCVWASNEQKILYVYDLALCFSFKLCLGERIVEISSL